MKSRARQLTSSAPISTDMKHLSATYAAFTAAVLTAAVALPAAASTGATNGGASATPPPQGSTSQAQAADYKPVKATWYGPGLFGNHLACGGRLTHHTLGVAHKSLPCGTKVALRYRGRTLVVPVVDRGPYSRGVSYDLTEATARKLGMTQTSRLRAAPLSR
jgi:rare lipoprotein A